ncbi:hypothetical protein MNB_SM-7-557 [hydrothermal vent metagenome]|uniref:Uncharacterized protein n=1 Tax=hydrothermal vent metagenome TaxID=652676 RepID=A0A1W1C6R4_9ZZZZ
MFDDLFNFSMQRTRKQALGFYFAYSIFTIMFLFIFGIVMALIFGEQIVPQATQIGRSFAILVPLMLSFEILRQKRSFSFVNVLIAFASGILGVLGIFFGLLPTAYLTTLPSR